MVNIEMLSNGNKGKIVLLVTIVSLLVLGTVVIVAHKSLARTQKTIYVAQDIEELIDRLDKSMKNIKEKDMTVVSDIKPKRTYVTDKVYISGILWDLQKPLAIINNKVLGIGDEIEDLQVVGIKERSVTIKDKQGNEKVSYLYENKLFR